MEYPLWEWCTNFNLLFGVRLNPSSNGIPVLGLILIAVGRAGIRLNPYFIGIPALG